MPLALIAVIQVSLGSQADAGVQFAEHLLGQREVLRGQVRSLIGGAADDGFGQGGLLGQRAVPHPRRVCALGSPRRALWVASAIARCRAWSASREASRSRASL